MTRPGGEPEHEGFPVLRTALSVVAAFVGAVLIYSGWFWASGQSGGCGPGKEHTLAVIGWAMVGAGALTIVCALFRRVGVAAVFTLPGFALLVVGLGTALSCLQ